MFILSSKNEHVCPFCANTERERVKGQRDHEDWRLTGQIKLYILGILILCWLLLEDRDYSSLKELNEWQPYKTAAQATLLMTLNKCSGFVNTNVRSCDSECNKNQTASLYSFANMLTYSLFIIRSALTRCSSLLVSCVMGSVAIFGYLAVWVFLLRHKAR